MTSKVIAALVLLAACGGAAPVNTTPDGGAPPGVLQAGTYQPAPTGGAASLSAVPVGPALVTTMITDWSGAMSMVLPNYDFVRGALRVNQDGTLQLGTGNVLVHQDGKVEPAVIVGNSVGSTVTGTVNGTVPFSLALTTIQAQDFTVAQMAGSYLSASTNTGTWAVVSISASGSILGYAYASDADRQAGIANRAKGYPDGYAMGTYQGTITHTDAPIDCKTCIPTPNSFNIGFSYRETNASSSHLATYGFAYFTAAGLVALTVHPYTGEQFTATFAKQ